MSLSRKTALAGVYEHPTRFAPEQEHVPDHGRERARRARRRRAHDPGRRRRLHDRDRDERDGHRGLLRLPEPDAQLRRLDLDRRLVVRRPYRACRRRDRAPGCARSRVVVYGSTAASQRFAIGTGGGGGGSDPCDQYEAPFGPTTVGAYAMMAQRHMHEYGTTSEQLAEIAVTMRLHASMNPAAKYRDPITVEDVLASRDHFVAAASARLLHHQRRRRRAGGDLGRARARPARRSRSTSSAAARPCAIRRAASATSWRSRRRSRDRSPSSAPASPRTTSTWR